MNYTYRIIENVLEINKRESVYIPEHKNWIELSKILTEVDGIYSYEVIRLGWKDDFEDKDYIEENFDTLFVEPTKVVYPEPEQNEEEMI